MQDVDRGHRSIVAFTSVSPSGANLHKVASDSSHELHVSLHDCHSSSVKSATVAWKGTSVSVRPDLDRDRSRVPLYSQVRVLKQVNQVSVIAESKRSPVSCGFSPTRIQRWRGHDHSRLRSFLQRHQRRTLPPQSSSTSTVPILVIRLKVFLRDFSNHARKR